MTPSESALEALARAASNLNKETDHLNEIISGLEKRLGEMKLGVSVWLDGHPIEETEPSNNTSLSYRVGYAKVGNEWRLAVKRIRRTWGFFEGELDQPFEEREIVGDPAPLANAPRSVRVHACGLLDELIEELTHKASYFTEIIAGARQLLV